VLTGGRHDGYFTIERRDSRAERRRRAAARLGSWPAPCHQPPGLRPASTDSAAHRAACTAYPLRRGASPHSLFRPHRSPGRSPRRCPCRPRCRALGRVTALSAGATGTGVVQGGGWHGPLASLPAAGLAERRGSPHRYLPGGAGQWPARHRCVPAPSSMTQTGQSDTRRGGGLKVLSAPLTASCAGRVVRHATGKGVKRRGTSREHSRGAGTELHDLRQGGPVLHGGNRCRVRVR